MSSPFTHSPSVDTNFNIIIEFTKTCADITDLFALQYAEESTTQLNLQMRFITRACLDDNLKSLWDEKNIGFDLVVFCNWLKTRCDLESEKENIRNVVLPGTKPLPNETPRAYFARLLNLSNRIGVYDRKTQDLQNTFIYNQRDPMRSNLAREYKLSLQRKGVTVLDNEELIAIATILLEESKPADRYAKQSVLAVIQKAVNVSTPSTFNVPYEYSTKFKLDDKIRKWCEENHCFFKCRLPGH